ncbi:hypothetical protein [Paenibacillus glycinis]|uniref:Uncharacterized protein n=1 Tax=Paenibacillus glycinis TaxID=2697035 RepID=A0ABW9XQ18_9BACL|nr:hypothetical protein [Paenibacillus glycinis]NBD24715.1 hypothetical protein [Paenibacillus glycinis]
MTATAHWIEGWIKIAGMLQLGVAVGSLAVPRLLRWKEQLTRLRPLLGQIFWTYAAYIFVTNLFFAGLSLALASSLADGSRLSTAVCGFIACYWAGRLGIQFFYFDKRGLPIGGIYRYGEWLLVASFAFFAVVYGGVAFAGFAGLSR